MLLPAWDCHANGAELCRCTQPAPTSKSFWDRNRLHLIFGSTRLYNLNSSWAIYFLPEGEVWFNFVDPKEEEPNCIDDLPLGTVLRITVKPSRSMTFGELGLDDKKIKLVNASNQKLAGFKGYLDATNGFAVVLERGEVYEINYFGEAKDKRRCPAYFHNLKKRFAWIDIEY